MYLFSGQGSNNGDQFASSCSLGSPWATDVGMYCWLRDLWEFDLTSNTFKRILGVNDQSIVKEGSVTYDYTNNTFYLIGGYTPSGNYAMNVNNYGNSWVNDVYRFRVGIDNGFSKIQLNGTYPSVPNNSIGNGVSFYDSKNSRIIYVRRDGIWSINL